ncbi:MAG: type II secretion system GspH family protein [Candidatus Omnitrophica bacterium]|nr:type II secretion system GspH family protein [Candidatus Omnitrophota bacterium]
MHILCFKQRKNGFTILEILVALTILVVVFSLITLLYVRAARTRNVINAYNEVSEVLTQMIDLMVNGRQNFMGNNIPALKIVSSFNTLTDKEISFTDNGINFQYTITENTLKLSINGTEYNLDANNKIELQNESKFEYYTPGGGSEITLVKIILSGKSTNPAMKKMNPMRIETSVRLKNKLSF